jgi:hypothetical protein
VAAALAAPPLDVHLRAKRAVADGGVGVGCTRLRHPGWRGGVAAGGSWICRAEPSLRRQRSAGLPAGRCTWTSESASPSLAAYTHPHARGLPVLLPGCLFWRSGRVGMGPMQKPK